MKTETKCSCKIGVVVAALLGLGVGYGVAGLTCGTEKKAEPLLSASEQVEAARGAEAVRALTDVARDGLIASRFGLLYVPGGTSAFDNAENYSAEERVQQFRVHDAALYIDRAGNAQNFYRMIRERNEQKQVDAWITAMRAIGATSDEAVFAEFREEAKLMAQQAVKHHLGSLTPDLRAAWLAEQAHLLFTDSGRSFFTGRVSRTRVPGLHKEVVVRQVTEDAKYMDAEGKKHTFNVAMRKLEANSRSKSAWQYATYCAVSVGPEAVLEVFADELNAMRKATPEQ